MAEQLRRFLRLKQVIAHVGLCRSAIYQKVKSREFPTPYLLSDSGRAVAWLEDEVAQWQQARIQAKQRAS